MRRKVKGSGYVYSLENTTERTITLCNVCSNNEEGFCNAKKAWCYIARHNCTHIEESFIPVINAINNLPTYNELNFPKAEF